MITHIIFNLKFSMDVSSINITARMCSQAMLIQFPRSAPLSAPVALYTPFKFCTFLFFVTQSRIFGPNTSGVENTPNFLSFNVIRNPALHWTLDIGHWTLNILCLTLDIGHEALETRQRTWTIGIGHWTLATYPCWTAPASPLTPCRAASHLPLFLLLCLQ